MFKPLRALARDLDKGAVTAAALVETALERIQDPAGEGARAFIALDGDAALEQAAFHDHQRKAGRTVPSYAGIPIGVKDPVRPQGAGDAGGLRHPRHGMAPHGQDQQMFTIAKVVEGMLASLRG